jgi:hypothetical protein
MFDTNLSIGSMATYIKCVTLRAMYIWIIALGKEQYICFCNTTTVSDLTLISPESVKIILKLFDHVRINMEIKLDSNYTHVVKQFHTQR